MRYPLTLLLTTMLSALHAQPFNWQWSVRDTSTLSSPNIHGFATDALGNSYVAGSFYGSVSFGGLPELTSAGQSDVYVAKYDDQGIAQWAVRAGGADFDNPYDLAIDGNGGIFITGGFESPTAGFGTTDLDLTGNMDIFVAKLGATDGTFLWAQRHGSNDFQSGNLEWGKAIACDASGNVYVTGCFRSELALPGLSELQGCSQYYNSFVMKLDTDGNGLWSRRPDCGQHWSYSASEGQTITVGADGMLYAGFRIRGDTLFVEGDTLVNEQFSGQAHDGVVVKYALDGTPQWTLAIGAYGYDDVQALQADAAGNLYIAMHREGDYGHLGVPGVAYAGNLGTYRNVILKCDANGHLLSGTRMGNSTYDHDITSMVLETPEKLLVAGWHQGNFTIADSTPNPGIGGNYGIWLARFDTAFSMTDLFARRYSYPRGVRGLGLDGGGNIYLGGYFQDSLALPGLAPMQNANASAGAMFLARIGDFPTDVVAHDPAVASSVFPVPSNGVFTVSSTAVFNQVRFVDVQGRTVREETFAPALMHQLEIDTAGLLLGTLFHADGSTSRISVLIDP
ncbi:MAG: hypothetical protein JNM62_04485 [Flavobacteriales bacterium]|nr:hypothetical protein [Flavobacteriales bacterium]